MAATLGTFGGCPGHFGGCHIRHFWGLGSTFCSTRNCGAGDTGHHGSGTTTGLGVLKTRSFAASQQVSNAVNVHLMSSNGHGSANTDMLAATQKVQNTVKVCSSSKRDRSHVSLPSTRSAVNVTEDGVELSLIVYISTLEMSKFLRVAVAS